MRLKFDARARAILRRLPVVNLYSAFELLLLAALAIQGARLVWTMLTPVSPLGAWRPAGPALPLSPGDILRGFDPFYRVAGASGPAVVTALQLTLFGTRIDEAQGGGSAIIAGPDGVQNSVAIGEEIIPNVILKAVAFDHVTIDRGGVTEDLFLDQSGGAAMPPAPPRGLPGGTAAPPPGVPAPPLSAAGGVSVRQIQSDIGFIPRVDGGRVSGLVVRSQGSGAGFRAAGLREGDIVTAIGGRPVSGPADIERLADELGRGGSLAMTVERGGQTLPLAVAVAPQ